MAGGRTGKFLVAKLIDQGYRLKVLLRTPENFELRHPLVEIIKGDAIDPVAIHALVKNSQAVISTVGQRKNEPLVAHAATTNVVKAMTYYEVRRYLLVAGSLALDGSSTESEPNEPELWELSFADTHAADLFAAGNWRVETTWKLGVVILNLVAAATALVARPNSGGRPHEVEQDELRQWINLTNSIADRLQYSGVRDDMRRAEARLFQTRSHG